jgi:four helix bundle protein
MSTKNGKRRTEKETATSELVVFGETRRPTVECYLNQEAAQQRTHGGERQATGHRRTYIRFACQAIPFAEKLVRRGGVAALVGRQLARAATSIGSNLEEAVAAQSRADFIAKAFVSLKEARESLYWLRLAEATLAPLPANADGLRNEARELVAILRTIAKNARDSATRR